MAQRFKWLHPGGKSPHHEACNRSSDVGKRWLKKSGDTSRCSFQWFYLRHSGFIKSYFCQAEILPLVKCWNLINKYNLKQSAKKKLVDQNKNLGKVCMFFRTENPKNDDGPLFSFLSLLIFGSKKSAR